MSGDLTGEIFPMILTEGVLAFGGVVSGREVERKQKVRERQ
jgi:hypothetical protein